MCTECMLGDMFERGHLEYPNGNSRKTLSQENCLLECVLDRTV
jgi:hypothetical protein